ncbi:MAG: cell division protein FtsZ [Clostridia bacterium]|nr:cell division protein FtsZ [Clostridia bacterium]
MSDVRIKVIGVGGAGNNAVNRMIDSGMQGAEFVAVNTDIQVLDKSKAETKVQIGIKQTAGRGAGADPEKGRKSAEENVEQIEAIAKDTDMVFLAAGMGGGTGTGAAPIVADISRKNGALVVGVVTKPFAFEGSRRMNNALAGIEELSDKVDSLVVIPNERLKNVTDQKITFKNAFEIADDVLRQAISSISDLITIDGIINLDFADVCAIMKDAGYAHMGLGKAQGKDKAKIAAELAVYSPLLETSIDGAKGILINVIGSGDLGLDEVDDAISFITKNANPEANVIFGFAVDDNMEDEVRITIVATGFDNQGAPQADPSAKKEAAADDPWGDIMGLFNK